MIENKKIVIILFVLIWAGVICAGFWGDRHKPIGAKEAMRIVQALPVTQSFLKAVDAYDLSDCVEERVKRPCDTDWVTCIEEAWVVELAVNKKCNLHDGRVSVTVVVNALDRSIVSIFPEQEYFVKPQYCLEDYDCLCDRDRSLNFVFGQLQNMDIERTCDCVENRCEP